jgi:hypothetical protein
MLTNAARKENPPCAPRSFPARAIQAISTLAVGALGAMAGCGGDGATLPRNASYVAVLTGANEIPPRSMSGSGSATFDVRDGLAAYRVTVANLTMAPTLAHILIGGKDQIGIPIVRLPLMASSGVIAAGTIDLRGSITFNNTTISGDSLHALFENGNAYVNVYTPTYPGGEIRGQIER